MSAVVQDVKIKVGYDATRNRLFGQVRENNWTLDTDFVRTWALKYDLWPRTKQASPLNGCVNTTEQRFEKL